MVELLPWVESVAHRAIEGVLETLLNDDRPLPPWVFVDDGGGSWRRHATLLPVEERRRSVLAASSEASLYDALRFEIGGASWLPISTPSMEAACEAAATYDRGEIAPMATRGVVEVALADATDLCAVGWWPQSFWNRQVGSDRLFSWLTVIADRLGTHPVILPGPVLVVVGRGQAEIEAALVEDVESRPSAFPAPPTIVDLSTILRSTDRRGLVEAVLAAVVGENRGEQAGDDLTLPVLEIPSGRRVGRWSPSPEATADGPGWLAVPVRDSLEGGSWRLVGEDGSSETVVESISPSDQEGGEQMVIRIPGFIGAEVRRGSPAGLLVERLARLATRVDRPLWVPSVDAEGVRFLLGLPGPIWVDGPGVPT